MSQWGPLEDRNRESIISSLCSVEPLGRVGSDHLIHSFSSTMVHYTIRQDGSTKAISPVEEDGNNVGGGRGGGGAVPSTSVPHQEAFIFMCPRSTFVGLCKNRSTTGNHSQPHLLYSLCREEQTRWETAVCVRKNTGEKNRETGKGSEGGRERAESWMQLEFPGAFFSLQGETVTTQKAWWDEQRVQSASIWWRGNWQEENESDGFEEVGKRENQWCLLRSLKCQDGRALSDLHTQFT